MKYILEIEDQGTGIVSLVVSQDPPAPKDEAAPLEETIAGIITEVAIDAIMAAIDECNNIVTTRDDTTKN